MSEFAEQLLRPYLDQLKTKTQSKEFNDSVWGTVVLSEFEIVFLDSPLLQRLRRISQLGVVHWTFPSAVHTRFEHSIGSVRIVQSLCDSLNRNRPTDGEIEQTPIPQAIINSLRLAALCHDIGHGFMSHVSENALLSNDYLSRFYDSLRAEFGKDKVALSEAAAYYLISSQAFADLIRTAKTLYPRYEVVDDLAVFMKKCIVGQPVRDNYPLIHELISGPFDCDKQEYMSRDAIQSGVPVVTDVKRLAQKVRMVGLTKEKVPKEILANVTKDVPMCYVQGIALSGATTIDELMIGRALLFDKVYRHQKVRTAEAMVAGIVEIILSTLHVQPETMPLKLSDSDLLDFDRSILGEKLDTTITDDQWLALRPARDLAQRLKDRRFFIRAYAFAGKMPQDPYVNDSEQRVALEQLQRDLNEPERLKRHRIAIVKRTVEIINLIKGEALTEEDVRPLIALDPPSPPHQASEIARAYLVTGTDELISFADGSAQSSGWSNAYPMTRELGFVFASREIAPYVYLACEFEFMKGLGIRTPRTSLYYAKVDEPPIDEARLILTQKGFYENGPFELRSNPPILNSPATKLKLQEIVKKLSLFEGGGDLMDKKARSIRVTPERLETFLRQFEHEDEISCILNALDKVVVISRSHVVQSLEQFLAGNAGKYYVCPLGSARDSSSILTYFAEDIRGSDYDIVSCSFAEALSNGDRPIIFLDDIIGSGKQACTIMKQWMGLEDVPLDEDHVNALNEHQKGIIRSLDVTFLFAVGLEEGKNLLEACLSECGLRGSVKVLDTSPPKVDWPSEEIKQRFSDIGFSILESNIGEDWSESKARSRSLGYGNEAFLVAFPYNVPAQSLTLLWATGTYKGKSWLPLLPRRRKI